MKINKFCAVLFIFAAAANAGQSDADGTYNTSQQVNSPMASLSERDRIRQQKEHYQELIELEQLKKVYSELTEEEHPAEDAPAVSEPTYKDEINTLKEFIEQINTRLNAQEQRIDQSAANTIQLQPVAAPSTSGNTETETKKSITGIYLTKIVGFQDNPMASFSANGYIFDDVKAGDYLSETIRVLNISSNYALISDGQIAQRIYVTNHGHMLQLKQQERRRQQNRQNISGLQDTSILN